MPEWVQTEMWPEPEPTTHPRLRLLESDVLAPDDVEINWDRVSEWPRFKPSDREVLELVVRAATDREIQSQLPHRSADNIKRTISHLLDISGAASRTELTAIVLSKGAQKGAPTVRVVS